MSVRDVRRLYFDTLDDGLVCEFRFDRNSGLTLPDLSGHGNHGTLVADPAWVTTAYGPALEFFDGGERVTLQTNFNNMTPITLEFFVWLDLLDSNHRFISNPPQDDFYIHTRSGYIEVQIDYAGNNCQIRTTIGEISTNEWTHVVVIHDENNLPPPNSAQQAAVYFNAVEATYQGVYDGTGGVGGIKTISNLVLSDDTHAIDGKLAFFRVYDRVLSEAEIYRRYEIVKMQGQQKSSEWIFPLSNAAAEVVARRIFITHT